MEFSEVAKTNAVKFLKDVSASGAAPDPQGAVPMNWPSVSDEEVEGECLAMARGYLARK